MPSGPGARECTPGLVGSFSAERKKGPGGEYSMTRLKSPLVNCYPRSGCPWDTGTGRQTGVSYYGNINSSRAVNYSDPWGQFPTWMNITPIVRAGTSCLPPPALAARRALRPYLSTEEKRCCSQTPPPFPGVLFDSPLPSDRLNLHFLIYFLPVLQVQVQLIFSALPFCLSARHHLTHRLPLKRQYFLQPVFWDQ